MNMKLFWTIIASLTLIIAQLPLSHAQEMTSDKEKLSYSLGASSAKNLTQQGIDIDVNAYLKGFKEAASGKLSMSEEDMKETLAAFQKDWIAKEMAEAQKKGEANKKAGEKFLEENKKKPGVVTLPSGLQYKVIVEGTGKTPTDSDTVETQYRGQLIDGTEFDSSYKRGQPATFPVKGVIPGWTEALKLMKEGAKWELYVPSDLAYGERGAGNVIGPHSTLIFEVELLKIK